MRMQVIRSLVVASAVALVGCTTAPKSNYLDFGATNCGTSPVVNGLQVYVYHTAGTDKFSFGGGTMSRSPLGDESLLSKLPRNDPGLNQSRDIQTAFPREPRTLANGESLGFPAASSVDERRWAATIVGGKSNLTEVVIRNGQTFHRVTTRSGYKVATLAWNPDASLLAVVQWNYRTATKGLGDLVSPHPVPYSDILLAVYRASGELVCQTGLLEQARYANSWIHWTNP